jgi:Chs5-Arf1p-binding protein BUD7/BCH1
VWTIFRAEVAHFKTQHVAYRKTGLEWEILGELGLRLHHKEEAKEVCIVYFLFLLLFFSLSHFTPKAFQRCLDTPRYSQKPWAKLMETYAEEGDIQRCIQTAIRVAAYQWADYTEMTVSLRYIYIPLRLLTVSVFPVPNTNSTSLLQTW